MRLPSLAELAWKTSMSFFLTSELKPSLSESDFPEFCLAEATVAMGTDLL